LLPKQMKNNGLKRTEVTVTEDAIRDIVRYYTREAGVRALEREVSKICRKVVKTLVVRKRTTKVIVNAKNLDKYLGVRVFSYGIAEKDNQVGQVTGLAWTEVGGELLTIESASMPGKGVVQRTGSIGDVMKESVEAARSVVRSRSKRLGIKDEAFEKQDIHIHFPEGATPKDGPSAGVAMTGEITLRGEVLPIGGLKEKLLAAVRGGIRLALIPQENVKDLTEIPDTIKNKIEIVPVKWIDKVLELALEHAPVPLDDSAAEVSPTPAAATPGSGLIAH
jgi:ATP-dependent Lon protease